MKSESENLCGYSKRKGCSKLTEKTILLIKKFMIVSIGKIDDWLWLTCQLRYNKINLQLSYCEDVLLYFYS